MLWPLSYKLLASRPRGQTSGPTQPGLGTAGVQVCRSKTYSESGEISEMLWEVAEWGGEGDGPKAGLGGASTDELKEAKMEERTSRCSLDVCRLGGA